MVIEIAVPLSSGYFAGKLNFPLTFLLLESRDSCAQYQDLDLNGGGRKFKIRGILETLDNDVFYR